MHASVVFIVKTVVLTVELKGKTNHKRSAKRILRAIEDVGINWNGCSSSHVRKTRTEICFGGLA